MLRVRALFIAAHCTALVAIGFGCRSKPEPTAGAASASSSTAPPSASAQVPVPVPVRPPKLELVATSGSRISLGPPGPQLLARASGVPYRIDAKGLHQESTLLVGLTPLGQWEHFDFYGSFPERSSIVAMPKPEGDPAACREQSIFNWSGERWQPQRVTQSCEYPVAVAPWKDGRMLAIVPIPFRKDWRFALARGTGPIALPAPTAAPAPADAANDPEACRTVSLPESADGTAAGFLFVVGRKCDEAKTLVPIVERFAPSSSKATVDSLPETGVERGRPEVLVRDESRAYVTLIGSTQPYLARWDGKSWTKLGAPGDSPIASAALDPAGGLWVAQDSRAARLEPDGSWLAVEAPAVGGNPTKVLRLGFAGDALWVVGSAGATYHLFGPSSPGELIQLPSERAIARTEGDGTGPLPATPICGDLLVILRRHVAAGQRFEEVARLAKNPELAGAEYVIDAGPIGDQLAAIVPSMRVGERMVESIVEQGKPRPHFVCRKPKVKSKVSADSEAGRP